MNALPSISTAMSSKYKRIDKQILMETNFTFLCQSQSLRVSIPFSSHGFVFVDGINISETIKSIAVILIKQYKKETAKHKQQYKKLLKHKIQALVPVKTTVYWQRGSMVKSLFLQRLLQSNGLYYNTNSRCFELYEKHICSKETGKYQEIASNFNKLYFI